MFTAAIRRINHLKDIESFSVLNQIWSREQGETWQETKTTNPNPYKQAMAVEVDHWLPQSSGFSADLNEVHRGI